MSDESFETRLTVLEQRMARVEKRLMRDRAVPVSIAAPSPPPLKPRPVPVTRVSTWDSASDEPLLTLLPVDVDDTAPEGLIVAHDRRSPSNLAALEHAIGLKWTGWVGAIVLVIGVVLGIQFAYQQHWFGGLSPSIRLAFIAAAGFALIGSGEYVLRRINPIPAASLFGAGVGTLFVGAYAGYAFFELYSPATSNVLMALSALVGALVAMRGNMVSIAVLSILGGAIAPLLAITPQPSLVMLLIYLLALQAVALFLSGWGQGEKWWVLRGLSLACTIIWMTTLLVDRHTGDSALLPFMLVYAGLYHAEVTLTTVRRSQPSSAPSIGSALVLTVTAALTAGLLGYYADASRTTQSAWVMGLTLLSAGLGFGLPRLHQSLSGISTAHRIAAAALLVLFVPVATDGVRVEVGWMLLAVAFALTRARLGSRIALVAAQVAWLAGVGHLALEVASHLVVLDVTAACGNIWLTVGATPIGANAILAWLFVFSGHIVAALLAAPPQTSSEPRAGIPVWHLSALCGTIWIVSSIVGLPSFGATAWIVAYAWLLAAASRRLPHLHLEWFAAGALALATGKWVLVDTAVARLGTSWSDPRSFLNPLSGTGLLLAASLFAGYAVTLTQRSSGDERRAGLVTTLQACFAFAALVVLLQTGALEIDRYFSRQTVQNTFSDPELAAQVALSIYGATFAVVSLAVGLWRRLHLLRYFALALLGLVLLKVMVVDLSDLSYGYRIISFLGLGLLMLSASVMYGKMSPRLLGQARAAMR